MKKHVVASKILTGALAVAMVREHAEEWHVDPEKIFVCGFSDASLPAKISARHLYFSRKTREISS